MFFSKDNTKLYSAGVTTKYIDKRVKRANLQHLANYDHRKVE